MNVLDQDQYFLIGEKGTGKTIIAQYLSVIRQDKNCSILDFSTIDFITSKKLTNEGYLKFVQDDQIWQILLMVIAAEIVVKNESGILAGRRFKALHDTISEFYENRFSPEFPVAIQMIEKLDYVEKLSNKYVGEIGDHEFSERSSTAQIGSSPLNKIRESFVEAFIQARISSDHVIFIDEIDIKPEDTSFDIFIHTLRSFARAELFLNEKVFTQVKGRKRIKFVLLIRPDIFDKLNLQNQSAKVSDNSVILNWDTTYKHHRSSDLFALTDRFMGKQTKDNFARGAAWDHFVSSDVYRFSEPDLGINRSFQEFLRRSWFRPRDIIRSLHICQSQPECHKIVTREGFEKSFKDFSNYLYGEVRDFSRFYFSDDTFSLIERFFNEVHRLDVMNYDSIRKSHDEFLRKLKASGVERQIDPRISDVDEFLQILYSSNIICWRSDNGFGGVDDYWAFRERSATQLEPKVGTYCEYAVHYGLRRAMRLPLDKVAPVRDRH